jgi:serine protease Do
MPDFAEPLGRRVDTSTVNRASRSALRFLLPTLALLVPALAFADEPARLPPRKGAPPTAPAAQVKPTAPAPGLEERVQRGVVIIERAGQALGVGAVLMGDGRIITALSPLGPGNDLDARFADGSVSRVKLGHHDRAWDLALLVPQTGRWVDGLAASSKEPVRPDAAIRSFTLSKGRPVAVPMILRSHRSLLGGDDRPIDNALEVGSRISPLDLGTPLVDEDGRVVGVLGRGCAPNEGRPCTPVAFGAPIQAIKGFLRSVPASAAPPAPFLGIQGVPETMGVAKGVRVLSIAPRSPAEEAKLRGGDRADGDVVLAVDGVPVTTPEALSDAIRARGVGERVAILLFSQGKYREVPVVLRAAPTPTAGPPANPAELPNGEPPAPTAPPVPPRPKAPPPPPTHR